MSPPIRTLARACVAAAFGFASLATLGSAFAQPAPTGATAPSTRPAKAHDFARWEKEIAALEAGDRAAPPPTGGVLFIGSSTIRLWKTLAADFPDHKVINRGFGGSQIVDATYYADRILFPHEPRLVVLRSGGNDIHAGKSAEQVFADFKAFVAAVRAKLPNTEVAYLSLAPSIARWDERDAGAALNGMIQAYAKQTPGVRYIDASDITLDPDGKPRPELFVADKLHYSPEGYKLLAERVRPHLGK